MPKYELIPIEQLIEPEIPAREAMDDNKLNELADSVREIGFVHPLAVVLVQTGKGSDTGAKRPKHRADAVTASRRYEIVDGHRRYKVGVMLQHNALPCLIFTEADTAREAIKLHTALFREDLSTAEEAAFLADLITKYDYTEEQLCRAVRQKPSWINERLSLMRGNQDVFDALRERKINLAVAKQLNRVKDVEQTRYFLGLVIEGGATAVTVTRWVSDFLTRRVNPASAETGSVVVGSDSAPTLPGTVCMFCRKEDQPFNMLNVWIHEWELKMLHAQLDRAAPLPPEVEGSSESQNGRS